MTHDRRGRGPYPPEFRREAVALYRSSGKSLKLIATELGVSVESLRAWVKQHDVDVGEREGLTSDEREELRRLRRENVRLKQEREILKRAAAFFARETENR
jgi:transposase